MSSAIAQFNHFPQPETLPEPHLLRENQTLPVDPQGELYDPVSFGMQRELRSGEQVTVPALVVIDGNPMAVLRLRNAQQGTDRVVLGGLSPDEQGNLKLSVGHLVNVYTNTSVTVGRRSHEVEGGQIIGLDGLWAVPQSRDGVSRRHVTVSFTGKELSITDHSTNGTKVTANVDPQHRAIRTARVRTHAGALSVAAGVAPSVEPSKPTASYLDELGELADTGRRTGPEAQRARERLLAYQPIGEDPKFHEVAAPFERRLKELIARQKTDNSEALAAEIKGIRDAYEQALKPYLAARLELFRDDKTAGYLRRGGVYVDEEKGQVISTTSDKPVTYRSTDWRTWNDDAGTLPKMGQVLLPSSRIYNWAGSASEKKKNHKTGQVTTSNEHIVNLAAAQLAGNWGDEHEPVELERCTSIEAGQAIEAAGLYDYLGGRLPLYKVRLGVHRIAAQRLIEGIDAPVRANKIRRD